METEAGFIGWREKVEIVQTVSFDPAAEFDTEIDELLEKYHKHEPAEIIRQMYAWHLTKVEGANNLIVSRILARLVAFLLRRRDSVKIAAIGISYAVGLDLLNGQTMTDIAAKLGCTRAAISKAANEAADALGIPRSRYLKSGDARKAYAVRARKIHDQQRQKQNDN